MTRLTFALATLLLTACGPVIGDPCTVNTDCGSAVCMNKSFAPGGLCSLACTVGGTACPAGSTCVKGVIDGDTPGCLRTCTKDEECRSGYVCRVENDSLAKVCVGTAGL